MAAVVSSARANHASTLVDRKGHREAETPTLILVDGHVHHYPCFTGTDVYSHASQNLASGARSIGAGGAAPRCLLLSEGAGECHFRSLADGLPAAAPGWRIEPTQEAIAVRLVRPDASPLTVIAGRQIKTAEGLEVLALLTDAAIADGHRLALTLDLVSASGGLAVLPWGFGKWWGSLGRLVERTLQADARGLLFLGDNGGRARGLPRPPVFERAAREGIFVLPGSDPLPLVSEAARIGSYGFALEGRFDPENPARSLVRLLAALHYQPPAFGRRVDLLHFGRSQIHLRRRRRQG